MSPVLVWTVVSLVGCLAALYGAVDAFRDLRALKGDDSGRVPLINGRRTLAWSTLRGQALRFIAMFLWVGLGVWAILLVGLGGTWNPFTVVLVIANGIISANAVLDVRDRVRIREALIEAVREGHTTAESAL